MVFDGCAYAPKRDGHSTRPWSSTDGQLNFLGLQLGYAQRHTGHVLLGYVGGQLRPEDDRFPDHVTIPGQLGHPVGFQDGDGADGVPVPGWYGGQRGGHQLPDVRGRGERDEHEGRPRFAVHTHVQHRCAVRVRVWRDG